MAKYYFLKQLFFSLAVLFCLGNSAFSQNLEQNELWMKAKIGFSFQNDELARINAQKYFGQELDNNFVFQAIIEPEYALADRLFVGPQLGFGSASYDIPGHTKTLNFQNYKIGWHVNYFFLKVLPKLYLNAEIGGDYNYFHSNWALRDDLSRSNSYLKAYLDAGISFFIQDDLLFSLVFTDIFSYHSSLSNFDQKEGFNTGKVFKDFIDFPHFSVSYRLN